MNAKSSTVCSRPQRLRKSVLIVDDEAAIRMVLMKRIRVIRPLYEVDTASSAEESLEMLERRAFEVMVTDLKLPDADGIALADIVHKIYPWTWSILMTGYGAEQVHKAAYKTGCVAYVEKPLDINNLMEWIDHAMGCSSEQTERGQLDGQQSASCSHEQISIDRLVRLGEVNEKPWFTPLLRRDEEDAAAADISLKKLISVLKNEPK